MYEMTKQDTMRIVNKAKKDKNYIDNKIMIKTQTTTSKLINFDNHLIFKIHRKLLLSFYWWVSLV